MKIQFHLSGLVGLEKFSDVPGLRLNVSDAAEACYLHDLSMGSDSEVRKVAAGTADEGLALELQTGRPTCVPVDKIEALHKTIQKAVLYTVPPEVLVMKFDNPGVFFTGDFSDEGESLSVLDAAMGLEVAGFEFTMKATPTVVELLSKAADGVGLARWRVRTEKGTSRFVVGTGEGTPVGSAKFYLTPQSGEVTKVNVMKFSLEPFKSFDELFFALSEAISASMVEGVFGYLEYTGEDGEKFEDVPMYWGIDTVTDSDVVVCVYGPRESLNYRVSFTVGEDKTITLGKPEAVKRLTVWVREGETVQVVPEGAEEPTQEPAGEAAGEGEGEAVAAVDGSPRDTQRVPSRKVAVVHTDEGDRRYVLGVVLEPNDGKDAPMNPDTQGDVYSAADIEKAAHAWMSEFLNTGVMHKELAGRRIVPVESYIAPASFEIGEQKISKGTWLVGAIVEDEALWEKVKSGEMTGWSMGGMASREGL